MDAWVGVWEFGGYFGFCFSAAFALLCGSGSGRAGRCGCAIFTLGDREKEREKRNPLFGMCIEDLGGERRRWSFVGQERNEVVETLYEWWEGREELR